jgi:hypothetical protein
MNSAAQTARTPYWLRWLVAPRTAGPPGYLIPRWIFLRAIGFIYFSAFYSLVFQIRGLLAPDGLLPANAYLKEVGKAVGHWGLWYAPTLLWLDSSGHALTALCWLGMVASALLLFNVWPRGMLAICFVLFLSFVSAAQDFSGYQSDGMLLAAGFVAFFLCLADGGRDGVKRSRLRELRYFYCSGCGFASTSNRESQNISAAIRRGGI